MRVSFACHLLLLLHCCRRDVFFWHALQTFECSSVANYLKCQHLPVCRTQFQVLLVLVVLWSLIVSGSILETNLSCRHFSGITDLNHCKLHSVCSAFFGTMNRLFFIVHFHFDLWHALLQQFLGLKDRRNTALTLPADSTEPMVGCTAGPMLKIEHHKVWEGLALNCSHRSSCLGQSDWYLLRPSNVLHCLAKPIILLTGPQVR